MTLSADEFDRLTARCGDIPMTSGGYLDDDFVVALMNTVLDYQQRSATVERALAHFREHRWAEIRTLGELEACFARFPDDREGNEALATHLWGYRLWTRAGQLRVLVEYFDRRGVDTLDGLRAWALLPSFEDFRGQVRGLGFGVYQGLRLRMGANTVKPDVRLHAFVRETIGRRASDTELVDGLEEVARRLGVGANVLDWSLWDSLETASGSSDARTS